MNSIEITARARAFSGEGVRLHRFMVSGGVVLVWDQVAGYYTTCHAMTPRALARIAKLAR